MLKSVCIVGLARFFCFTFGNICVKTNEDTPILSATNMFANDFSLWQYTVYADIRLGFSRRRPKLKVGWSKSVNINALIAISSEPLKIRLELS